MKKIDLTGAVFTRLTVIKQDINKKDAVFWICECYCGNTKSIIGNNLRRGKSKSCGCLNKEAITTHGESKTPLYSVWSCMINRCYTITAKEYKNYGARGIKVCEAWKDYKKFKIDMQEGYGPGLSIDRIDVNGNYEKSNCKWSTLSEQLNNKRNTIRIETPFGLLNLREIEKITDRPINNLRHRAKDKNITYDELIAPNHQSKKYKSLS